MGISFSTNRRNNSYYHHHPPPPPPPPPPPGYSSYPPDPSSSSTPPPPNFVFAANAPYSQTPYHPPPAAPLHPSYYQFSNAYNGPRSNFHPGYYGNHNLNGWAGSRPPANPVAPPPPYFDHQTAKKIRNEVNVHKDTINLDVDADNPECSLVSFTFDALVDGSITIIYFAKEEVDCSFVSLYPDAHMSVKVPFQKGLGQKFCQPSGTGVDLGFFPLDDLSKPSRDEAVFPLVILADAWVPSLQSEGQYDHSRPTNSQITQAVIEKNNEGDFQAKVVKQVLWVEGVRYELREIYGIAKSADTSFDDNDPGKECVICMSEPKDTAVLPCRHMCLCSECAKELRLQTNKCPICRQPIQELIEIRHVSISVLLLLSVYVWQIRSFLEINLHADQRTSFLSRGCFSRVLGISVRSSFDLVAFQTFLVTA